MSRTLTSATTTEIGNPVTTPAYFVEILFSSPLRLSTRGTLPWNGNTWNARGITISGLGYDIGTSQQSGTLMIIDDEFDISTLVLREGVTGRGINVWKFYGSTPAPADPQQIFAGVGDASTLDAQRGTVSIALVQRGATELYSPRRFQTRAGGFSILPVTGRIIYWNGVNYKLERSRG